MKCETKHQKISVPLIPSPPSHALDSPAPVTYVTKTLQGFERKKTINFSKKLHHHRININFDFFII